MRRQKELVVRAKVVETKLKGIAKSLRKESWVIRLQKQEISLEEVKRGIVYCPSWRTSSRRS